MLQKNVMNVLNYKFALHCIACTSDLVSKYFWIFIFLVSLKDFCIFYTRNIYRHLLTSPFILTCHWSCAITELWSYWGLCHIPDDDSAIVISRCKAQGIRTCQIMVVVLTRPLYLNHISTVFIQYLDHLQRRYKHILINIHWLEMNIIEMKQS